MLRDRLTDIRWYVGVVIFLFTNVPFICKNSNFSLFFLGANVRVVLQTRKQRHSNASAVAKLSGARESWNQFQIIKNYHRSAWVSILLSRRVGLKNSRHRIKKPKERAIHTSMYEQGLTTKSQ